LAITSLSLVPQAPFCFILLQPHFIGHRVHVLKSSIYSPQSISITTILYRIYNAFQIKSYLALYKFTIVGFMGFGVGIALLGMPLGYAISGFVGESLNVQLTYIIIGVVLVLICIPPLFNKEYRSI
jgi:hypothetical protein